MKKILVLGHRGMLGNAVFSFFSNLEGYQVSTLDSRFGDSTFEADVRDSDAEYIINCIGMIPQRKPEPTLYTLINIDLPTFLENTGKKVIHPTTDCEFIGNIPEGAKYPKHAPRDADDDYGKSKAFISEKIEREFSHTKMIRTSIIGHELKSSLSLLDWFLHAEGEVKGYTNHFWNGITTLQWAKIAQKLIENWDTMPTLNQFGTEINMSKYEVLELVKRIYNKQIIITPFSPEHGVNKCLETDELQPTLETQLIELKDFYHKN